MFVYQIIRFQIHSNCTFLSMHITIWHCHRHTIANSKFAHFVLIFFEFIINKRNIVQLHYFLRFTPLQLQGPSNQQNVYVEICWKNICRFQMHIFARLPFVLSFDRSPAHSFTIFKQLMRYKQIIFTILFAVCLCL